MVKMVVHRQFDWVDGEMVRYWGWSVYVGGKARAASEGNYKRKIDAMRGAQRFVEALRYGRTVKYEVDED